MKANIHPKYEEIEVTCSCKHTFKTRSTKKYSHIETCSKCHPAYNPKNVKAAMTEKAVDQYNKRFGSRSILGAKGKETAK